MHRCPGSWVASLATELSSRARAFPASRAAWGPGGMTSVRSCRRFVSGSTPAYRRTRNAPLGKVSIVARCRCRESHGRISHGNRAGRRGARRRWPVVCPRATAAGLGCARRGRHRGSCMGGPPGGAHRPHRGVRRSPENLPSPSLPDATPSRCLAPQFQCRAVAMSPRAPCGHPQRCRHDDRATRPLSRTGRAAHPDQHFLPLHSRADS